MSDNIKSKDFKFTWIWYERNHLEITGVSYLNHARQGITLSLLCLANFFVGIIHALIPNCIPFMPISIFEIMLHNYERTVSKEGYEQRRTT